MGSPELLTLQPVAYSPWFMTLQAALEVLLMLPLYFPEAQ
jgi:hypothetical protein